MNPPEIQRRHFFSRLFGAIAAGAWLGRPRTAEAQSGSGPYLGEIRMFAGDFEPYGWRFCDGRLLAISEYESLFALIGTTYGGDGTTTFALPDLRGRIPFHPHTMQLAEPRGQEGVALVSQSCPAHSHNLQGTAGLGLTSDPAGAVPAKSALGAPHYALGSDTSFAVNAVDVAGSSMPHNNMMPSLCVNFIICIDFALWPQP